MKPSEHKHQWADAWLLLSIIYACRTSPATLTEIVRCGDYINRAIFTESELTSGFYRLTEGGWISGEDDAWVVTEKTLVLYRKVQKQKLSAFAEMERVGDFLGAPRWPEETKGSNKADIFTFPGLTKHRIDKAFRDYAGPP